MKSKLTILSFLVSAGLALGQAITTNRFTLNPNAGIPDGNPVGLTEQFTATGLSGVIADIQLTLDITGGFNGDLYAYLAGPQGQLAILLNRPGITAGNPFGYGDSGMSITLAGAAVNNIHDYGSVPGYSLNGTTWAADGRNIDPQSAGTAFDAAATGANLSLFQARNPNGLWTFFIADLSGGGGTAALNNLDFFIITVPEPSTLGLSVLGGVALLLVRRRLPCRH